jgi:hypothetical protein
MVVMGAIYFFTPAKNILPNNDALIAGWFTDEAVVQLW